MIAGAGGSAAGWHATPLTKSEYSERFEPLKLGFLCCGEVEEFGWSGWGVAFLVRVVAGAEDEGAVDLVEAVELRGDSSGQRLAPLRVVGAQDDALLPAAVDLAGSGLGGELVEVGPTETVFSRNPKDRRTFQYVHGMFG